MKYTIGRILKVRGGCEGECGTFKSVAGQFIKITRCYEDAYEYDILDSNKNKVSSCSHCFKDEHLVSQTKDIGDINTYDVGDIIVDNKGDTHKVLEVFTNTVVLSTVTYHDSALLIYTPSELKRHSFSFQDTPEEKTEELTMEELCKELGRTVKIKK